MRKYPFDSIHKGPEHLSKYWKSWNWQRESWFHNKFYKNILLVFYSSSDFIAFSVIFYIDINFWYQIPAYKHINGTIWSYKIMILKDFYFIEIPPAFDHWEQTWRQIDALMRHKATGDCFSWKKTLRLSQIKWFFMKKPTLFF